MEYVRSQGPISARQPAARAAPAEERLSERNSLDRHSHSPSAGEHRAGSCKGAELVVGGCEGGLDGDDGDVFGDVDGEGWGDRRGAG